MCSLHTQGKDFEIHEDILKAIYVFIKRRLKRLFHSRSGLLLYPIILISLYFVSFSGIMEQDMGTVRVAMTADNPYHYVFEQAGDYFEIIDVDSDEAGKLSLQRTKQTLISWEELRCGCR